MAGSFFKSPKIAASQLKVTRRASSTWPICQRKLHRCLHAPPRPEPSILKPSRAGNALQKEAGDLGRATWAPLKAPGEATTCPRSLLSVVPQLGQHLHRVAHLSLRLLGLACDGALLIEGPHVDSNSFTWARDNERNCAKTS